MNFSSPVWLNNRIVGAGAAAGPLLFVVAWLIGGFLIGTDYSPIPDPISRLAAAESDVAWLMNTGFVGFGILGFAFAFVMKQQGARWAAVSAVITSVATFGVAATPLGYNESLDLWHGVAAISGYASLVAVPLLAFGTLRGPMSWLARYGLAMAGVAVICLVLMTTSLPTGLFQRIGLTAVDSWIVAVSVRFASGD